MIHHNYEIETGIQAFSTFKEKTLLPDAFVCVNVTIQRRRLSGRQGSRDILFPGIF